MKLAKILKACRVDKPEHFRLADYDPAETFGLSTNIEDVKLILADGVARLGEMQQRLYANGRWAVLVALQGMDAAGKDGVIKHVMSGINPQGCEVHAFKAPSAEELAHDFLWRTVRALPQRGHIGIFNRSHYEEVLVVRVHPEMLARQKLPPNVTDGRIWEQRFKDIRGFERHLARNGTRVLKFHLRISKEEQRKRFLARIDEPEKNWKFSTGDIEERGFWKDYMHAYEQCLAATSTKEAPWYAVPADDKENARLIVSQIVVDRLEALDMHYPPTSPERRAELQAIRKRLTKVSG